MKIYSVNKDIYDYDSSSFCVLKYFLDKKKAEKYLKEQQEEFMYGRKRFIDKFGNYLDDKGFPVHYDDGYFYNMSDEDYELYNELLVEYNMYEEDKNIHFYISELEVEE